MWGGGGGGGGGVSFSLTNISSFRFSFLVNEGQHFKKWFASIERKIPFLNPLEFFLAVFDIL